MKEYYEDRENLIIFKHVHHVKFLVETIHIYLPTNVVVLYETEADMFIKEYKEWLDLDIMH